MDSLLSSLRYRANIVYEALNNMDNISCRKVILSYERVKVQCMLSQA